MPEPKQSGVGYQGLLPALAINAVGKVLAHGARKNGTWTWLEKPKPYTYHAIKLLSHMEAWLRGEDCEEESGENHLAHVVCRALFLLTFQLMGYKEGDDREKEEG